jgi:hypothetical protein
MELDLWHWMMGADEYSGGWKRLYYKPTSRSTEAEKADLDTGRPEA